MKKIFLIFITLVILVLTIYIYESKNNGYCLTGAFLSDSPAKEDIISFKKTFGKKPYFVMVFIDWNNFINPEIIKDIYSQNSVIFISWEPWIAATEEAVNYGNILDGANDDYIKEFATVIKGIENQVYIRFAHEANGNWYPWSGEKIGSQNYVSLCRHIKDVFDDTGTSNVKWVFSVNNEDVPAKNNFMDLYPGNDYVDYIGIDGYNWGNTKDWSNWLSFKEIFLSRCRQIRRFLNKPIIITEFGSTSSGGDKSEWIKEALKTIRSIKDIKGFVLFNVDKETDWSFRKDTVEAKALKSALGVSHFKDSR
ncbi:MAG: glycosyl hydrolase [Candidatus Omnitrophica bacterium]|nr:glycosyl hydrolase [Candidatus Omnitrophota bacterium]